MAPPSIPSINGDSNITGGIAKGLQSVYNKAGLSPGTGAVANSVLNPGGDSVVQAINGFLSNSEGSYVDQTQNTPQETIEQVQPPLNQQDAGGRRVRLRAKPGGADKIYGTDPILTRIKNTDGMIWPYQPTITYNQEVDYKSMELTHTNQDIHAYHRTPSLKLTVDGEWSVQNQEEGLYAMSCIHFLRTITKMNFGSSDPNKGTPPPVLLFDAYGRWMFSQLPVIVTGFSISLPKDIDYVPIDMSNTNGSISANFADLTTSWLDSRSAENVIWLPAVFNIQVNLIVQNSPTRLRKFNLEDFRNGKLVRSGGWV